MKRFVLATLLVVAATMSAQAGGYRYGHHHRSSPSFSFYYGGYSCYSPFYASSYSYCPSYGYDYACSRPNFAVRGTLLGALTGGIIGNSIYHQGWEGAGIGAAAGLVLGSVAEHSSRARERAYYSAPAVSYAQPGYIANSPTVNDAPTVPAAPQAPIAPVYRPVSSSSMSGANSLFGR